MKHGFSIQDLDTYQWPVDVRVPVINSETGEGEFETRRFIGTFNHLDADAFGKLVEETGEAMKKDMEAASTSGVDPLYNLKAKQIGAKHHSRMYAKIWAGWDDSLTGSDGNPLPYSDFTKERLLKDPRIRDAVVRAHNESQGGEKVRQKN